MGWPSLFARTLAVLPLLAPLLSGQVKYTGAEKGALGFGPLYTRVQDYGAVGIEIGYAADYRAGVAAFVTATGHAASLTIVGIAVETENDLAALAIQQVDVVGRARRADVEAVIHCAVAVGARPAGGALSRGWKPSRPCAAHSRLRWAACSAASRRNTSGPAR